jgi:hypothetical protein
MITLLIIPFTFFDDIFLRANRAFIRHFWPSKKEVLKHVSIPLPKILYYSYIQRFLSTIFDHIVYKFSLCRLFFIYMDLVV